MMQQDLLIETRGPGLYEITSQAMDFAQGNGLLTLFVRHTSCS
ncbi:MAG: YjbQ family protein, partial [Pseudomonadota bacterium]